MQLKNVLCVCLLSLVSLGAIAQKNYREGFVVTHTSDTVRGWIDYQQWDRNPTQIDFKKDLQHEATAYTPHQLRSFSVADDTYETKIVSVSTLSSKIHQLAKNPSGNYATDTLFLMPVASGIVTLYYLKDQRNETHYFIQKENQDIETLIYYKYSETAGERKIVRENRGYTGQLMQYLGDCEALHPQIKVAKYRLKELVRLVEAHHTCKGQIPLQVVQSQTDKKPISRLALVAGTAAHQLHFSGAARTTLTQTTFEYAVTPVVGLAYDAYVQRNRQKFSVYNELLYRSYQTQAYHEIIRSDNNYEMYHFSFNMHYLQLSTMFRYHFVTGSQLRPFLNAGFANGLVLKSDTESVRKNRVYNTERSSATDALDGIRRYEQSLVAGAGASYRRFNAEIRYQRSNGMSAFVLLKSTVQTYACLIGYTF